MERDNDVIELGAASVETKGPLFGTGDDVIGLKHAGLSDD